MQFPLSLPKLQNLYTSHGSDQRPGPTTLSPCDGWQTQHTRPTWSREPSRETARYFYLHMVYWNTRDFTRMLMPAWKKVWQNKCLHDPPHLTHRLLYLLLRDIFHTNPQHRSQQISRLLTFTSRDQVQISSRILAAMNSLSLTPKMPFFPLCTSSVVWTEVNAAAEALPVFRTTHMLSRRVECISRDT